MIRQVFVILIVLVSIKVFPQGESAIPFLLLPPSPTLNGAGATGTASLIDDPYKVFFNPAHLGHSSIKSNISSGFYPGKINWLKPYDGVTFNSYVFTAGYNLEKLYPDIPISIGLAYSKNEFDFGELFGDESKDYYSAYSVGLGYHSIVNVSAGLTVKDVTSIMGNVTWVEELPLFMKAEVTALDYGILVNIPLNNLLKEPLGFYISNGTSVITDFNYTIGYALQNVGDEVYYVEPSQADPIGRTARLGQNIDLGISLQTGTQLLNVIDFSYSIDVEDILIKRNYDTLTFASNMEYDGMFGQIKPFKHLFLGEGDPDVVLHKGLRVEFFEAFSISTGGFDRRGFSNRETSGYGIRTKGLLRLINIPLQNETVKFISDNFDIQYINTSYIDDDFLDAEFNGVIISVGGF